MRYGTANCGLLPNLLVDIGFSGLDYTAGYFQKADNYVRNSSGKIDYWRAIDAEHYGKRFEGVRAQRLEVDISDRSIQTICNKNLCY